MRSNNCAIEIALILFSFMFQWPAYAEIPPSTPRVEIVTPDATFHSNMVPLGEERMKQKPCRY